MRVVPGGKQMGRALTWLPLAPCRTIHNTAGASYPTTYDLIRVDTGAVVQSTPLAIVNAYQRVCLRVAAVRPNPSSSGTPALHCTRSYVD
jgi:hypothetical protein